MFEIKVDDRQLKRLEKTLAGIPRAMPKVMSRGLTNTGKQARTQIGRMLARETGIKVGAVKDRLRLQKATYTSWRSRVTVSSKPMSLNVLNPRQTRKGLTVKHGRKRVLIRRAFQVRNQWFIRLPQSGSYKGRIQVGDALDIQERKLVARMPIAAIIGPRLSQVYRNAQSEADRIYRESSDKLAKNIRYQVEMILKRRSS